jgi:hypothetical protein
MSLTDRDEAAETFVKMVDQSVYVVGHRGFMQALSTGIPKTLFSSLSPWFHSLPEQDREKVDNLVKQAMHSAIFDLLCIFDGVSGFERNEGRPMNYAILLEVFEDMSALRRDNKESSTRINPVMQKDLHLHDLFQELTEHTIFEVANKED